ncbi:MAG TPA: hypothetical protein PLB89_10165 [Flavobacteriales bacterium]|nr:hypothetical protein [Flavobacteriales bacterium]
MRPKMTILALLAGLPWLDAQAQTLLLTNSIPQAGTVESRQLHTRSAPPAWSTTGTGNDWDASGVAAVGDAVIISYMNVPGTPYAGSYSTSDICASSTQAGMTNWYYWEVNDNLVDWVGVDDDPIIDGRKVCEYPFNIGDAFTDTYINFGFTTTFTMEYVASGSIQAPFGTINNVVMFSYNDGSSYELYRAGNLLRRIGVYVPGVQLEVSDVEVSEVGIYERNAPSLVIGPQPATDEVLVQLPFVGEVDLSLVDMGGRTVTSWTSTGAASRLDLRRVAPGSYLLLARSGPSGSAFGRVLVAR